MKNVQEIMVTSPKYCEKNETLQAVAEKMSRSNIGSLPIVDENKKPVGIITDRDILLKASTQGKKLSEMKVQEIIGNQKVHTISAGDNLQTALKTMRTNRVARLPVVDKEQKLAGIVTLNHIVRKIHGSNEEAELGYKGEENIIKTIHSLADRTPEMIF